MAGTLHRQIHGRGEQVPVESILLTAGVQLLTIVMIVVLFFGVFGARAS
jgi:hypothetical protein